MWERGRGERSFFCAVHVIDSYFRCNEESPCCICVKWSPSDEIYQSDFDMGLKHPVVKQEEWYRFESLVSIKGSAYLRISNPVVHPFTTDLVWSHNRFYANRSYVDGTAQNDTEGGYCSELNEKEKCNYRANSFTLQTLVAKVQVVYKCSLG